jgi:hypothetical protein
MPAGLNSSRKPEQKTEKKTYTIQPKRRFIRKVLLFNPNQHGLFNDQNYDHNTCAAKTVPNNEPILTKAVKFITTVKPNASIQILAIMTS